MMSEAQQIYIAVIGKYIMLSILASVNFISLYLFLEYLFSFSIRNQDGFCNVNDYLSSLEVDFFEYAITEPSRPFLSSIITL